MSVVSNTTKRRNYGTIKTNRTPGAVKSLILEYEQVLSPEKCDNVKVMGGEVSTARPIGYSSNLVKQRISEFNKKQVECSATNELVETTANYQRSKSVDFIKKGKDEYSRLKQATPRLRTASSKAVIKTDIQSKPDEKKIKQKKSLTRKLSDKIKDNNSPKLGNKAISRVKEKSSINETISITINNFDNLDSPHHHSKTDTNKIELRIPLETSNSIDEFEEIENKLRDVDKTIGELTNSYNELSYVSEVHHIFTNNQQKNETISDTVIKELDELENVENIDIYVYDQDDKKEKYEDFGEVSKEDLLNTDFVEAYNQTGYELLITSVSSVNETTQEHITEDSTLETGNDANPVENKCSIHSEQILTITPDEIKEDLVKPNGINNLKYFTTKELESLIPDEDDSIEYDNESNKVDLLEDIHVLDINTDDNKKESVETGFENEYETAIKSETIYYDSFRYPRISKVTSITTRDQIPNQGALDSNESNKTPDIKPKIMYIIEEIIETEKKYIDHLECILGDYLPHLKKEILETQKGVKVRHIFANIRHIHKDNQRFYKALKNCATYQDIAKTFIRYKSLFELYPLYCKNKASVDQHLLRELKDVVTLREKELNDQLGLASHLLTPIQRLGKYKLFLEQIEKELLRDGQTCNYINEAIEMIRKQMATGDLYIAVDSIKKSPIKLENQGWLLMKEKCNVIKPKKYEAVIFLFEKIVVFTTEHTKNSDSFIYRDSIYLDKLGISTVDYEQLLFILKRFPSKHQNDYAEYTIEVKKAKDKKVWTDKIEELLWKQLIECRDKQRERIVSTKDVLHEVPQTRKKKNSSSSLPGSIRPKSKFYVNDTLSGVEHIILKK